MNGGYIYSGILCIGRSSSVIEAHTRDAAEAVCIKLLPFTDSSCHSSMRRELEVSFRFTRIHPPSLLIVRDWFIEYENPQSLGLVTDRCEFALDHFLNHVCSDRLSRVSSTEAHTLLSDMLTSLVHLASMGVTHRDIKTSNILWRRTAGAAIWKLADFGSCSYPGSTIKGVSFIGTIFTASPEALQCQHDLVGPKADIWSLGCVVWEAVTLDRPFKATDLIGFQNSDIRSGEFPIDHLLRRPNRTLLKPARHILRLVKRHMLVPCIEARASPAHVQEVCQGLARQVSTTDGTNACDVLTGP